MTDSFKFMTRMDELILLQRYLQTYQQTMVAIMKSWPAGCLQVPSNVTRLSSQPCGDSTKSQIDEFAYRNNNPSYGANVFNHRRYRSSNFEPAMYTSSSCPSCTMYGHDSDALHSMFQLKIMSLSGPLQVTVQVTVVTRYALPEANPRTPETLKPGKRCHQYGHHNIIMMMTSLPWHSGVRASNINAPPAAAPSPGPGSGCHCR